MAHKTWFVAVDGSDSSNAAVELAVNTMKEGDKLILFHVSHHAEENDPAGKKVLEDSVALAKETNKSLTSVETYFQKTNNFGEEIVQQARLLGADYLVTGQRGLGKTAKFLLGSVSDYVAKHAGMPVLISHVPYL